MLPFHGFSSFHRHPTPAFLTSTGWRPLSADERHHGRCPRVRRRWPPGASGRVCSAARWEISCPPAATGDRSTLETLEIGRQVMFLLEVVVWHLAGKSPRHGYCIFLYIYIYICIYIYVYIYIYIYIHMYVCVVVYPVIFHEISSYCPEKSIYPHDSGDVPIG